MKKFLAASLVAVGILASASPSQAEMVFSDNFNTTTTQALNQTVFTNWTVTSGSVDVIGDGGSYALLPAGNGNYVDLDGSTGVPGQLTTKMTFAPGTYIVQFDLAGSQGGNGNLDSTSKTTQISFSIGGVTQSITLGPLEGLETYDYSFTTTAPGQLSFTDLAGGNNNIGNLLDNVVVTAVPEARTWVMMVLGFLAIGFAAYRNKSAVNLRVA